MTSLRQFLIWGQNWPKMAEKGPKWPKMAWMSEKWHPKPSPLDFCFSCGHFEWSHDQFTTILSFWAKIGQKWPKKASNDQKWPECLKSDIRNHFHWISALLAVILSGHMTSLRQFWIWGQNGQKWPKMTEKGPKWPKMAWMSEKWHLKPFPLDFCSSCGHFEWSLD